MKNKVINIIIYIVHIILFLGIEIILVVQLVNKNTVDIFQIISYLILGVIAYVGFLEILFLCRLTPFLPEFYLNSHKNICINSEINKIASSSIEKFASLLNITADEFRLLLSIKEEECSSFVKIKSSALEVQKKVETSVKNMLNSPIILTDSNKLISTSMSEVNYYINFLDVMYDPMFSEDIVSIMCDFIKLKLEPERLSKVLYIIVPYDSNLLLGVGVAKKLNKKAIKVLKEIPSYHLEKNWEGTSIDDFNEVNSIIIHDVLYTGRQIIESCKILYKNIKKVEKDSFSSFLFFSLCARKSDVPEKNGIERLTKAGFLIYYALEFDDKYINEILSKGK